MDFSKPAVRPRRTKYSFIEQTIAKRKAEPRAVAKATEEEQGGQPQDFLAKFLTAHAEDPERFTAYNVFTGLKSNVVAGSDTTGLSLSAILYYLLKHPDTLTTLRRELDDALRSGQISTPVTFKESQNLPYLQTVIKEAMRLHPAAGLPLERVVPEGGVTICGRFFPQGLASTPGSRIITNPSSDQMRVKLIEDKARLSAMDRYYMPFGLGSRTCIGKHISILEMSKLIPEIVRKFDFTLDPSLESAHAHWTTSNYWFVKPVNFRR